MMTFNRDSSFSLNIVDPEDPSGEQKVVRLLTIHDQLLIFTTTAIFKALPASSVDPNSAHADTRHSYEKLYSIGTQRPFVARIIIQFNDIFTFMEITQKREQLRKRLWACTRHLLDCESASFYVYDQSMKLMPECDKVIEENKNRPTIPPLPKIPDLNHYASSFFYSSKLMLIETFGFLHDFFEMPFNTNNCAHFNKHLDWIAGKFGDSHPLTKMLADDKAWIRILSECSNALRHNEPGLSVEFQNISFRAGNKFSLPAWRYNLEKRKLGALPEYVDLVTDLDIFCNNMMTLLEELLLWSSDFMICGPRNLALVKVPEDQLSADCPVIYTVAAKSRTTV